MRRIKKMPRFLNIGAAGEVIGWRLCSQVYDLPRFAQLRYRGIFLLGSAAPPQ